MNEEVKARYCSIEEQVTREILLADRCLGQIKTFDLNRVKALMHQRRHVAYLFTPMCEYFLASLDDKKARDIVKGIALEEFETSSHRRDFIDELHILGDTSYETLAIFPTLRTAIVMVRMWWAVMRVARRSDLERLVFLRYMGEITTGIEFNDLYFQLERLGALNEQKSRFLHPHIRYDLATDGEHEAHADRYLGMIVERIETDEDWAAVQEVITTAARLRERFYAQF